MTNGLHIQPIPRTPLTAWEDILRVFVTRTDTQNRLHQVLALMAIDWPDEAADLAQGFDQAFNAARSLVASGWLQK